jgi:hypothetical protein
MSRFIYCYAACHYAECSDAECHYAECRYSESHYAECRYSESYLSGVVALSRWALASAQTNIRQGVKACGCKRSSLFVGE